MTSTGNSKEMLAVIRNLKEARVLEKSLQTLTLEESYASKLLDLDSKMVRFKFGRLTKDIKKIKSHLPTDDIIQMRQLEKEGKFIPEHPIVCTSSSQTKIAAARRRLKLNQYRRVQSAMPALGCGSRSSLSSTPSSEDRITSSNSSDTENSRESERRIQCRHKVRPKTSIGCMTSSRVKEAELSDESSSPRVSDQRTKSARNQTSSAALLEKLSKAHQDIKRTAGPVLNYSSHEEKTSKDEGNQTEIKVGEETMAASLLNQYEERRKHLIGVENQSFDSIRNRKSGFVCQVEEIKRQNPVWTEVEPEETERVIKSIDSMASRSELAAEKTNRQVDLNLIKKVLYTPDKFEREYHTIQLMRKGKSVPETVEDLFVPQRYKEQDTDDFK